MDEIRSNLEKLKDPDKKVSQETLSNIYHIIYDADIKIFKSVEGYAVPEVIEPLIEILAIQRCNLFIFWKIIKIGRQIIKKRRGFLGIIKSGMLLSTKLR